MKTVFLFLILSCQWTIYAQLVETFTDGEFTSNPVWTGTTSDFIVNTAGELQISNSVAATSYLSTPHNLSSLSNHEWNLKVRQTFSPSSSNYGRIYLTAAVSDLSTNPDGFYLQLGEANSTDAVRLFKSIGGVSTQICASPDGQIANSFAIGIRVVRDNVGNWKLYVDPSGATNYGSPYTGFESSNLIGSHFGVLGVYTVSNATKFYFDNIYVGPEILDTQAPTITDITVVNSNQLDLTFSEPLGGTTILQNSNYILNPSILVTSVVQDASNAAIMHLTFSANFTNGTPYTITVASAADLSGNTATALDTNFTYLVGETAVKGDIIITEFFADPSPVIGLPELEFIEIYNRSNKYIDLTGWKIGDASSDGTIVSGYIYPGEYKILCATSSITEFPTALSVTSFPSLNNSGDEIVLKNPSAFVFDHLTYTLDWYHDAAKASGGYTIELINPYDPCSDILNWSASTAINGGTPGAQNSVFNTTPDTAFPILTAANALSPNYLELVFSEGIDSTSFLSTNFLSSPLLSVISSYQVTNGTNSVILTFDQLLTPSQLYTFTLSNVNDCWLNSTSISGSFALAENPVAGDIKINEILFDPSTGGSDFVELYNASSKVLNLKDYTLANFDNGIIDNLKPIIGNYTLFPNEYVVLTADSSYVKNTFPATLTGYFYQMAMPSYNNDSSTVYVLFNGEVLDKVSYHSDWQFSLLDATENKTLERIDPLGISDDKNNWHTAAEPIGFGTPGKQNSQYQHVGLSGDFSTQNNLFSPDNDGHEDVLIFGYEMPVTDMIATVNIYDDFGRLIKTLLKSELLGTSGTFSWDGINDQSLKSPIGIYTAVMEAFDANGKANFSKRISFTLAGKIAN
jgi:hypothetical protein